jgi:hypothetical protein
MYIFEESRMNDSSDSRCGYCGANVPAAKVRAHDVLCSAYSSGDLSLLLALSRREREVELSRRGRALTKGKKWTRAAPTAGGTLGLPIGNEVQNEHQTKFEKTFVNGGRPGSSRRH